MLSRVHEALRVTGLWLSHLRRHRLLVAGAEAEISLALRIGLKAGLLFAAANLIFALLNPVAELGSISLYNLVFPGRERLPFSHGLEQSYNLILDNLEAMFASHVVAHPKTADEYRVFLLGDSATWGWELSPAETLAGQLNAAGLRTADGRRVRVYNLSYPFPSLSKDLLLISYGLHYAPDLIVWPITLYSLDPAQVTPLEEANSPPVLALVEAYGLDPARYAGRLHTPSLLERTVVGRHRTLNDLMRLQFYGLMWSITGIDQVYHPQERQIDLSVEDTPPQISTFALDSLAYLTAGMTLAGKTPVLLVNEPVFVQADGQRLNRLYDGTAYAAYRAALAALAAEHGWPYVDLWTAIAPAEFTDSPLHHTAEGARQFAEALTPILLDLANAHLDEAP